MLAPFVFHLLALALHLFTSLVVEKPFQELDALPNQALEPLRSIHSVSIDRKRRFFIILIVDNCKDLNGSLLESLNLEERMRVVRCGLASPTEIKVRTNRTLIPHSLNVSELTTVTRDTGMNHQWLRAILRQPLFFHFLCFLLRFLRNPGPLNQLLLHLRFDLGDNSRQHGLQLLLNHGILHHESLLLNTLLFHHLNFRLQRLSHFRLLLKVFNDKLISLFHEILIDLLDQDLDGFGRVALREDLEVQLTVQGDLVAVLVQITERVVFGEDLEEGGEPLADKVPSELLNNVHQMNLASKTKFESHRRCQLIYYRPFCLKNIQIAAPTHSDPTQRNYQHNK